MSSARVELPTPERPRRGDSLTSAVLVGCFLWFITAAPVLLWIAFDADIPKGPRFEAPGAATLRLEPGTYAVYLDVTLDRTSTRVAADIRVTGPRNRPVPVNRAERAPDLSLDHERGSTIRDHGRFVAAEPGDYTVRVDKTTPRGVVVNPPWTRWRSSWPLLLTVCTMVGPLLVAAGVGRLTERW